MWKTVESRFYCHLQTVYYYYTDRFFVIIYLYINCKVLDSTRYLLNTRLLCYFDIMNELSLQSNPGHRTSWSRGNALDLYSRIAMFESRPGYRLSWQVYRGVPQFLEVNIGIVFRLGHDRFLSYPLKFTIHQQSCHPTLCSLDTESVVKQHTKRNEPGTVCVCNGTDGIDLQTFWPLSYWDILIFWYYSLKTKVRTRSFGKK
jgi:hypothetical protein